MELDKLTYSVSETAKLLNVSEYLIYEAIRQGKLQAVRFGRRLIVPANAIRLMLGISEAGDGNYGSDNNRQSKRSEGEIEEKGGKDNENARGRTAKTGRNGR